MTATPIRSRRRAPLTAILTLAAVLVPFAGGPAAASGGAKGLVGTWAVQITLRDCATNAPMSTVNSLVTFHEGGTISETPAFPSAFAVGQRGDAHGTWRHQGRRRYAQKMVASVNFDTAPNLPGMPGFDPTMPITPGFSTGWQTVTHTIELVDANTLRSAGTNSFYDANRDLYRSGCSTATAERFR